ncbi:MAG: hypothetical protein IJ802_01020, partial [Kiritimatiellae bacterium]|nr:hypothetical protein [Kiritimatiellia bacterium]
MKRTLGLIAGLWGIAAFAAVQTFEWTFDEGDVSLPVDGKGPVMLADGTLPHENIGAPWVMVKDVSFTAGEGASVSFEGERVLIAEGVKVARETAAVEDGGEDADTEAQIETASARDIALLGEFTGWHKGRRGAFGTARLYPVAYEEDGGKVWLAKRIVLKVESADTKAQLRKAAKIAKAPKTAGGKVDYLIITGEAYKDAFQVLADFRATNDCVTARVVTTEEIEGEYDGTRPDGGSDTQTKIRNCIKDYVDNRATKYVLLGGDSSVVPHRGCYTLATTATAYKDLPCDLYYACLDGTWDANANGTYGENADAVNYGIDVAVGRVPADTLEKAQTYIRKAIAYECDRSVEGSETFLMIAAQMGNKYPSGYSSEYPAKGWRNYPASTEVFGDGLDEFGESGIDTTDCEIFTRRFWKQIIKDGTGVDGTKHRMLFHNRSTREIINGYKCYPGYANMEINEYNPHYVWCMSHGYNPDYTAKTQAGHQLDGQWGRNWADQITGRADIFFALSCYVGAFDLDCFSKHLLFNKNGGSVAYIGCSRQSFYDYLFNSATGGMVADFGRSFFGQIFNNSARRVGDAFADMKEDMVRNFGAGG